MQPVSEEEDLKEKAVEIRAFFDLEEAEQRMNEARLAVLNEIDGPARNERGYRDLLIDLDQSIERYVGMVRRRLNGLYWRTSGIGGSENLSEPSRRKPVRATRRVANSQAKSESI